MAHCNFRIGVCSLGEVVRSADTCTGQDYGSRAKKRKRTGHSLLSCVYVRFQEGVYWPKKKKSPQAEHRIRTLKPI